MLQRSDRFPVICDVDGVLHRGDRLLPGAVSFLRRLLAGGRRYLFLTNSPEQTARQLHRSFKKWGADVPDRQFHTAAQATAGFVTMGDRHPRVFMIGDSALRSELKRAGAVITEQRPKYVVVGSGGLYNSERLRKGVAAVRAGARLIATNPETSGLTAHDIKPGTGALVAPIQLATNIKPYFIGKPNHLMIQTALRRLDAEKGHAYMVGDQMETDVKVGLETGIKTILILQGEQKRKDIDRFPYRPDYVFDNAGDIPLDRLP